MSILSIDVGEKRIGLAGTDELGITVQPLEVLNANKPYQRILEICDNRKVTKIIIGMPYNAEGNEGFAAKKVNDFKNKLSKLLKTENMNIVIEFWDEGFTTKNASKWLQEAGVKGKKSRAVIDKLAAAALLEDYLASR